MSHEIRTPLNGVLGLLDLTLGTELNNVQLNYQGPENVWVKGDPTRLLQILMKLCSNSVKFTDKGTVGLHCDVEIQVQEAAIALTVTDTGIGIEALVLPELFNSFIQADSSISRKFGGTGLGLTIVKALLTLMQGTISASSIVGVGSKFDIKLRLPLSQMQQQQSPQMPDIQMSVMDGCTAIMRIHLLNVITRHIHGG